MSNDTTSANHLIEDQVSTMLVEPLEAASVVLAAGPHVINSSEPVRIKKLVSGFTPSWVGENELIPDAGAAAFDEITLMPTSRKSIKTIVRVSNELIRQATVGVSAILQRRVVTDVANALDDALLAGDGADDTVTGILNQTGVTTLQHTVDDPDSYLDALALAASKEVAPNRLIVNGGDFFKLRKIKDGNGRYIMQPGVDATAPFQVHGVPVTVSNKIPAGKAILADMNEVAVVRDIDPTVTIDHSRYLEYDQVAIRVTTRYDLGLIRPEGVIILDTAGAGA